MTRLAPLVIASCFLVACGTASSPPTGGTTGGSTTDREPPFIVWTGSANGSWVSDANGDFVRFRADTGEMYFGSTTYSNIWVNGADLYFEGQLIGGIYYVVGNSGADITGLVGMNGHFLDIYGPENERYWQETGVTPVFTNSYVPESSLEEAVPAPAGTPDPAADHPAVMPDFLSGADVLDPDRVAFPDASGAPDYRDLLPTP